MKNRIEGQAIRLGHNFDVNRLLPAGDFLFDNKRKASYSNEIVRETPSVLKNGNIIIAGKNFGHGIPQQESILYLKTSGICCIIAVSFTRAFFRGAINLGIPLIDSTEAAERVADGEKLTVDFDHCEIGCRKGIIKFRAYPEIISKILASGGLLPHARKSLGR